MENSQVGTSRDQLDWVPADACTLPTPEQPLRVAAFDELFHESLLRAELHADPVQPRGHLTLTGDEALVRRVRELVAAETSCCSFFTFEVTEQPADATEVSARGVVVSVEVTVPAARLDVLEALISRAAAGQREDETCAS